MTSSLKLHMSRLSRFWNALSADWAWIPFAVFVVLLVHGATLGLTDDEAYYWVLAQRPALGYAYHPPAVAWSIAAAQSLLGWIYGAASPGVARLPAAFFSALVVGLSLRWLELTGVKRSSVVRGTAILLFPGFFAASWMIVPDLPLFAGFMIAFVATWRICFDQARARDHLFLALGLALAILSKYSGVLAAVSAGVAVLIWAPKRERSRALLAIGVACAVAALPILIWNATHSWASILYQLRDRHSGSGANAVRYARFWAIEALLAGPVLLTYAFCVGYRALRKDPVAARVSRYVMAWGLPAALVFCVQPLFSEFKPHWALIVWLPAALELAWAAASGRDLLWAKAQAWYGIPLIVLALTLCHFPLASYVTDIAVAKQFDPRLDVTNDMYGWSDLKTFIATSGGADALRLPVTGSRYQTASQAAFALGNVSQVTFVPRHLGELDEWPDLKISDHQGPGWPKLTAPVLYVADNRYTQEPAFAESRCEKLGRFEKKRWDYLARWIDVWRCEPVGKTP